MATPSQIESCRLRQPNLPPAVTDAVVNIYLDDASLEFPSFGIATTDPAYDKMLSLYALHLMAMANLISTVASESVKDVSASYVQPVLGPGETVYYQEFKRTLRRRKYPFYILHNT